MRHGLSYSEAGKIGYEKVKHILYQKVHDIQIKKQKEYDEHPTYCVKCKEKLLYSKRNNKFCDHSCAAAFTNKGIRRHGLPPHKCLYCDTQLSGSSTQKCCNRGCATKYHWVKIYQQIENGTYKNCIDSTVIKKYLIEKRGRRCEKCKNDVWIGEPIPLNVHHIDGDATNNLPINIQLICLNCHGLTETYGHKNKHSTRRYRYIK